MANNFGGTGQNFQTAIGANGKLSGAGKVASGAVGALTGAMSGGNKTAVGGVMSGVGSAMSGLPGIGGLIGAGTQLLGGVVDSMFGSNINEEAVSNMKSMNAAQSSYSSQAATNEGLLGDWGGFSTLANINKSDVGTEGWFSNKATDKTNELNADRNKANQNSINSFGNTASNISTQGQLQQMSQYFASGGNLNFRRNNNNKFTSFVKTNNKNLLAKGGPIHTGDGVFTNGVTNIGNGGNHEDNPNMGVPFGVDGEGVPNLVEQGEVVFNDYVFSKRILANGGYLNEVGLSNRYKRKPYADIANKLSRESSERPNDPISMRGLFDSMLKLQISQELQKEQDDMKQSRNNSNMFSKGGSLADPLTYAIRGNAPKVANVDLKDYGFNKSMDNAIGNQIKSGRNEISGAANNRYNSNLSNANNSSIQYERSLPSYLKYAPALGAGIGSLTDALGLTNKPDFEEANMVLSDQTQVAPKMLGNYMGYTPMDRDFYTNKIASQSAGARRSIENQAGGNRGAAMAGILASDYNTQNAMGDMFRQAEEYNAGQRQKTSEFNRGTDMFNSQSDMRAQEMNVYNRRRGLEVAAQMRSQEKARSAAGKSANLTNLFNSLGEVGREASNTDVLKWLERTGTLKSNMYPEKKALGGRIKRGYTY